LDQYSLKFAEKIKGFDPNQIFMDHMTFVGFTTSLANTFLFEEEEGDNQDPPTIIIDKKLEDIETVVSTIDQHKHMGRVVNERSAHSPNVS